MQICIAELLLVLYLFYPSESDFLQKHIMKFLIYVFSTLLTIL
jgi:hypothetical protein